MDKIYLLHGANGVGKTYILKEIFGVPHDEHYTHTGLMRGYCEPKIKNNILWFPEWRWRCSNKMLNSELVNYITKTIREFEGDVILDVSHRRKKIIEYDWNKEVVNLVLYATEEEIKERNGSRGKARKDSPKTKEETAMRAFNETINLVNRFGSKLTQEQLYEKIIIQHGLD